MRWVQPCIPAYDVNSGLLASQGPAPHAPQDCLGLSRAPPSRPCGMPRPGQPASPRAGSSLVVRPGCGLYLGGPRHPLRNLTPLHEHWHSEGSFEGTPAYRHHTPPQRKPMVMSYLFQVIDCIEVRPKQACKIILCEGQWCQQEL